MEFNLTEPETLVKLIDDAVKKSDKAIDSMTRLQKNSEIIYSKLKDKDYFFTETFWQNVSLPFNCAVGIDGSFQLVGGIGGQWYAPISTVRVILHNYLLAEPEVDIYWAGIEEIIEQEGFAPNHAASVLMLVCETKAIMNWGTKDIPSFVMIDGPIVDPPVMSYGGRRYIRDRCNAIKNCLNNSILFGCVKRSRDKYYLNFLQNEFKEIESQLKNYPSDQHLFAYLFANIRKTGYYGPLYTKLINISEKSDINKIYKKNGIEIGCMFYQNNISSQVLRIDMTINNINKHEEEMNKIISKSINTWSYSGHDYPAPIFLAHQKCNIREGCADILYDEIMTKLHNTSIENQLVINQMR
jgi:hypothetical protein